MLSITKTIEVHGPKPEGRQGWPIDIWRVRFDVGAWPPRDRPVTGPTHGVVITVEFYCHIEDYNGHTFGRQTVRFEPPTPEDPVPPIPAAKLYETIPDVLLDVSRRLFRSVAAFNEEHGR